MIGSITKHKRSQSSAVVMESETRAGAYKKWRCVLSSTCLWSIPAAAKSSKSIRVWSGGGMVRGSFYVTLAVFAYP